MKTLEPGDVVITTCDARLVQAFIHPYEQGEIFHRYLERDMLCLVLAPRDKDNEIIVLVDGSVGRVGALCLKALP